MSQWAGSAESDEGRENPSTRGRPDHDPGGGARDRRSRHGELGWLAPGVATEPSTGKIDVFGGDADEERVRAQATAKRHVAERWPQDAAAFRIFRPPHSEEGRGWAEDRARFQPPGRRPVRRNRMGDAPC